MDQRYSPYANWREVFKGEQLVSARGDSWWRSPTEIKQARMAGDLPLSGLHLVLDPGHIGGKWAGLEGRDFRISENDYPIREGELVMEVALRLRAMMTELGAEITLLREENRPINPKSPSDYLEAVLESKSGRLDSSLPALADYALSVYEGMIHAAFVRGELLERARLVNEVIRPDAVLSLHINAAPWPVDESGSAVRQLVDANHTHVLIFGCMTEDEMALPLQREQLFRKITNGSGLAELELGESLGLALGEATGLPPSHYDGRNAVLIEGQTPYLWARNLLLLRYIECPVVLLEPYIANSKDSYSRFQTALRQRQDGGQPAKDDILLEYTDAVVAAVLATYGPEKD